jgi:hypothetical protein
MIKKTIATLAGAAALLALQACSREPDQAREHEYLRTLVVPRNLGLAPEDVSYMSPLLKWKSNYFDAGTGDCQKMLANIRKKDVETAIAGYNLAVQNGMEAAPAMAFELQCVLSREADKQCIGSVNEAAKGISNKSQMVSFLFENLSRCYQKEYLGQPRIVVDAAMHQQTWSH